MRAALAALIPLVLSVPQAGATPPEAAPAVLAQANPVTEPVPPPSGGAPPPAAVPPAPAAPAGPAGRLGPLPEGAALETFVRGLLAPGIDGTMTFTADAQDPGQFQVRLADPALPEMIVRIDEETEVVTPEDVLDDFSNADGVECRDPRPLGRRTSAGVTVAAASIVCVTQGDTYQLHLTSFHDTERTRVLTLASTPERGPALLQRAERIFNAAAAPRR